jgi:hypothetical protein
MYSQATNKGSRVFASYENSIVISVEKSIVFPQSPGLLKRGKLSIRLGLSQHGRYLLGNAYFQE